LIALLIGAFMALQAGEKWITTSPFFEVSALEISGNSHLTPEAVKDLARIDREQNIFTLNTKGLRRRLSDHPWVKEVTVKRKLPRTVKIDLVERKALAVLAGETEALLDEEGIVLELQPAGAAKGFPRISGDKEDNLQPGQHVRGEKTLRALRMVREVSSLAFLPQGSLLKVDAGTEGQETIYLRGEGVPIVTGADSIDRKLELLQAVKEHARKKGREIKYIDLTFRDKVVVKYNGKAVARRGQKF
jgi:cell division protein FtsQ